MGAFRTGLLFTALTALFLAVGWALGGAGGAAIAFLIALATNAIAFWSADKFILRMYGARQIDAASAPDLHRVVARLAERAGLPMPRVYLIDSDQPNAFATGRSPRHAAVTATTGLLARLSPDEVEAVMAHELAHVKNRDTLTMTIAATISGAIGTLANLAFVFSPGHERDNALSIVSALALVILAPIAATLVQLAISRSREYAADRLGAEICGKPRALASALASLDEEVASAANPMAEANPATAHLFIVNPLAGGALAGLFSTHPPIPARIAALEVLAADMRLRSRKARSAT